MASETGPFVVDGIEWKTDKDGVLTRTEPPIPEEATIRHRRDVMNLLAQTEEELIGVQVEYDKAPGRIATLKQEIADLKKLADGSKTEA